MNPPNGVSDDQIQDYVDDRLSPVARAAVVAHLRAHPALAAEVDTLRRQNAALKALGRDILEKPVPERLRAVLREVLDQAESRRGGGGRPVLAWRRQRSYFPARWQRRSVGWSAGGPPGGRDSD